MTVRISSDAEGEAHLHAYRLSAKVGPGREATWRFVARAAGRFRIEWHASGEATSHTHGPPLATLEVMPP